MYTVSNCFIQNIVQQCVLNDYTKTGFKIKACLTIQYLYSNMFERRKHVLKRCFKKYDNTVCILSLFVLPKVNCKVSSVFYTITMELVLKSDYSLLCMRENMC